MRKGSRTLPGPGFSIFKSCRRPNGWDIETVVPWSVHRRNDRIGLSFPHPGTHAVLWLRFEQLGGII